MVITQVVGLAIRFFWGHKRANGYEVIPSDREKICVTVSMGFPPILSRVPGVSDLLTCHSQSSAMNEEIFFEGNGDMINKMPKKALCAG
ncbi:hypothetical protein NC653_039286 [Populus alba x Populus x berolinensis]|uniref:Uncharacterized protein n=1 Tax=Populus alba x Populus x berolinensis TaxID=444605 RepID=A0AAD6LAV8_9ROSI|nr:hypothetical protein NC653_039286 [Populus alba x Populus x berolinensis]